MMNLTVRSNINPVFKAAVILEIAAYLSNTERTKMKISQVSVFFFLIIVFNLSIFASPENKIIFNTNLQLYKLASNCPQNCTSCWEQCTKDDDCGVDQSCIETACGNRCVTKSAD